MKTEQQQQTQRVFVESLDGETYQGDDFTAIVSAMRANAWGGEASAGLRGYMKQVAKRISDWSGNIVRINTPENFIRDMAKYGLIKLRVQQ